MKIQEADMRPLPIAASQNAFPFLSDYQNRSILEAETGELKWTVAALVTDEAQSSFGTKLLKAAGLKLPVIVIEQHRSDLYRYIDLVSEAYQKTLLPPFVSA